MSMLASVKPKALLDEGNRRREEALAAAWRAVMLAELKEKCNFRSVTKPLLSGASDQGSGFEKPTAVLQGVIETSRYR